ncbi:unnamed protein product [Blepharisma stoltei]|uniref:Uncharacterized protein n=1 Tax=Blepharisma stoltei TaxID=1481888 RepID=A0AAU9JRB5_9CILI|nr:unnamed protein product [Blepharisma stoltei]
MKSNCLIVQSCSSPNVGEMSLSPHSENDSSCVSCSGKGTTFSNLVEGYCYSDFSASQEENKSLIKAIKELEEELSHEKRKRV